MPTSSGTTVELVSLDGSERRTLATLATSALATGWLPVTPRWSPSRTAIVSVDLLGHVSTLTTLPAGTTKVVFSAARWPGLRR